MYRIDFSALFYAGVIIGCVVCFAVWGFFRLFKWMF